MWEMKKLEDVCRIELGKTPARSNENFWDEVKHTKNIWLSIADMTKQNYLSINDSAEYISDAGAKLCKKVPKGTLLASFKLTLGRLGFTGCDLYTNEAIAALYIHNEKELLKQYLYWYLTYFDWNEYASSDIKVKGKTLNKEKLKLLNIILPPLKTQQAIVAKLDETFAELEKLQQHTEQNLINANELFNSYLNKIFTTKGDDWVECEICKYIKFIDYRGKTPKKTKSGLRLITAKNVRMGYLKDDPMEYVSPESYDSWMTRGFPQKGDVLFTTEAPLANVALLDTDDKIVLAQRIITMQPNKKVLNGEFLKYLLISKPMQKRIYEKGTGATVTGIKSSLLKKIIIFFPPNIEEQKRIIKNINFLANEVNQLKTIYNQKLKELAELKQSILEQAFNGKLNI